MKKICLLIILMLLFVTGCGKDNGLKGTIDDISYEETTKVTNYIKIETSQGTMIAELYPDIAPITVENFQNLVKDKFYDGLIFHRVIKDFMIQGGQNANKQVASIKGEFSANGVENDLKHERGVLSMARTQIPNSASSQFFIVHKTSPHLDGNYASFGKVIAGEDVIDKIAEVETDSNDKPIEDQVIESIRFVNVEE